MPSRRERTRILPALLIAVLLGTNAFAEDARPRKIVLIAGPKSHGPVGNGIHDYPWSVKLLKVMLENSNVAGQVRVEYHLDGWPEDETTLDDADTIMVVSDGRDGELYAEAPHFASEEHVAAIQRQIDRGCGFVTFHFSTFGPDRFAQQSFEWTGGYFDWEENGERKWYSAIETHETEVQPAGEQHPLLSGIGPFTMREEFYFNIRFDSLSAEPQANTGVTPILTVPLLPGREPDGDVVAWAKQRPDGGRGFGTTCGHFYANWEVPEFRKLLLNALVWTAGLDVPDGGVQAPYFTHQQITAALAGVNASDSADPIRVLLFAGNEAHKWHNWEKTTPAIQRQLEFDSRITVDVSHDIEDLAAKDLADYDVIVQNSYANWQDPRPLSEAARTAFVNFLQNGGGLVLVHFANGAWHYSLPNAGDSDWPEYRNIVRRVWNHEGDEDARSGHDAFGEFAIELTGIEHPITRELHSFTVTDELYFRQHGDQPIEPLIAARSKLTGQDEPLAWTYTYGKGRVFQTLLGHSEQTYATFEPCEMLRRSVAWCADRPVLEFDRQTAPPETIEPAPAAPATTGNANPLSDGPPLVEGRFGQAWNAHQGGLFIPPHVAHRTPEVTVDAWVNLSSLDGFQIIAAREPKSSPTHWEMYSYAGSGEFSVYMPGRGGEFKSGVNICDGEWHHVAMALQPQRLRMFVDGRLVLDRPLTDENAAPPDGVLAIGRLVEGGLGCAGLIDELRVTRGVRTFQDAPAEAPVVEENTAGLWRFDQFADGAVPDESANKLPATVEPPRPAKRGAAARRADDAAANKPNHWGREIVGFDWFESDSVDGRWQETDIGRWQACLVGLPEGAVRKGLSIRVGEEQEATVSYDTEHGRLRGIWTGGFLQFDPARYGLIGTPRPQGDLQFSQAEGPGWGNDAAVQYRGMYAHNDRVVLEYAVDGVPVRESPWVTRYGERLAITRTFEIGPRKSPLMLVATDLADRSEIELQPSPARIVLGASERRMAITARGADSVRAVPTATGAGFEIPAGTDPLRFRLDYTFGDQAIDPDNQPAAIGSLAGWTEPGERRWTEEIVTRGVRGEGDGAYVVDTITLPFDNPYGALFFVGGHDFFSDGRAALCTAHGDVWTVAGVDDDLDELHWRRFATGLFQPLGLKIVDDVAYVLGRDQITKLHDRNGDGEADHYGCFSNQHFTSAGGHDYVTCLEQDSLGGFWFVHGTQGVVRISADGKQLEQVATGLRNPNGMGLGPGDVVTAAPQEGEWTPASYIAVVEPGSHFGYKGPKITPERPLGYDQPLCWIPRREDNSSGGQVWAPAEGWGPLSGLMLHLSYGQCRILPVLEEQVGDTRQAGLYTLPLDFDSGIMRGRVSPHDGQLYVSGLRGWTTRAVTDGCLQRVRYTGREAAYPVAVQTMSNGIALTFSQRLDAGTAQDPGNWFAEQWNYRYSEAYGSPDLRPSRPGQEGRDPVEVLSATVLDDGRTVFIETKPLTPVDQFSLRYRVNSADGERLRQTYTHTLHVVPETAMDESRLVRQTPAGVLPDEVESTLQPGLLWRYRQTIDGQERSDARVGRMAALYVPAGSAPTSLLRAGPFRATAAGFVITDLSNDYLFAFQGAGAVKLSINRRVMFEGDLTAGAPQAHVSVPLHKGYNEVAIEYGSPDDGDAQLRVLWREEETLQARRLPGVEEIASPQLMDTIDPRGLVHQPDDQQRAGELQRDGASLIAAHGCARCHSIGDQPALSAGEDSIDLRRLDGRLRPEWVAAWLLSPGAMRNDIRMPALLAGYDEPTQRQHAADLTAWLFSVGNSPDAADSKATADVESATRSRFDSGDAERGRMLFEDLACIACHHFGSPEVVDEYDRVSLMFVGVKFTEGGLRRYLAEPHARHPLSRMPDFRLSDGETEDLAAYVGSSSLERADTTFPRNELPQGDAQNGRALFGSLGCVQCHISGAGPDDEVAPPLAAPRLTAVTDSGCLAETASTMSPRFDLNGDQRHAIRSFLAVDRPLVASLADDAHRLIGELRCTACHDRDTLQSPRRLIIVEEGADGLVPEHLPTLTWAGEKLRADWMQRLFRGEIDHSQRTWLPARMPSFPVHAELLANGLAAQHGVSPMPPPDQPVHRELAELGRELMLPAHLDCRQCHGVGSEQPRGDANTQIALGINFADVRERMRHDFYHRFVLDPPRFDVNIRMPRLAAEDGTTRVQSILGGDATAQFEAIWQFIQSQPPRTADQP